jgi:hypothetical protein
LFFKQHFRYLIYLSWAVSLLRVFVGGRINRARLLLESPTCPAAGSEGETRLGKSRQLIN